MPESLHDPISVARAVAEVAPRYAIAKASLFALHEGDDERAEADTCILLEVACNFSRGDAMQFRRFVAEELGCTVDVAMRSALIGKEAARADATARVIYENPAVTPLPIERESAPAEPSTPPPPAPQAPTANPKF